ncbi:ATP-binding protein [Mucilaginibacter pedocola]|nr:HAMP domain-containing sensor histidine kinase [Mucilaginibacter pedocola]
MITKLLHKISSRSPLDRSRAYGFLAEHALQQRMYSQAETYIDRVQKILYDQPRSKERDLQFAKIYLLKGDVLFAQGLYSYAFQYYYKSRRQVSTEVKTAEDHAFVAQYDQRRGMIAYKQENFLIAARHYKEVLQELKWSDPNTFDRVYETQGALSNLSSCFLKLGHPDSALHYYSSARDLLQGSASKYQNKNEFLAMARGVIIGNMGDAWMMKKDYRRAERCYLEDIRINDRPGRYQQDALMTKLKLARLYMRTQRLQQAGKLLALAGNSPDLADSESLINFLMTRADYAQASGQLAAALRDLRKRSAIRDSVQQARRRLLSANMGGIFHLMELEQEKDTMEKRDDLKTYATILIILMASVIALLLFRNMQNARKRIKDAEARNAELQFALNALEVSNKENAQVSGLLAHDIRNPLHALSTIITLMQAEERTSEDQELLSLGKESIQKINLIVEDILHQKNELDLSMLDCRECDLAALLRHSVALLRFKAAEKQQKIEKTSVRSIHLLIDQHKLWRVMNNILVNAIKFSPIGATIWVELKDMEDHVLICIRDEGIGIPEALQESVFQGSKTAQRTGTSGEKSFGMGLHAARQIIEAHGGTISLYSDGQQGTTFTIRLPKN